VNDNEDAITIYTVDDSTAITGIGTTFSKFTFKFARGQTAKVELGGQCRDIKRVMNTTLNNGGQLLSSANDLTLSDPTCEPGGVIHLTDDSDPQNVIHEYIQLGNSTNNLEFTDCDRGFGGTTAQDWDDGWDCTGYKLEDITVGSPIRGLNGGIFISPEDDDKRMVKLPPDMEATVTIDEKHKMLGAFGDGGKMIYKVCPENREVSVSISGYCEDDLVTTIIESVQEKPMRLLIQCGNADGRSFAIAMPKVQFNPALIGDSKGDVTKVTLESRAVMFDSDNQLNSVVFAY
jgi:hypothetical protein